jgi:hypothetical protein
MAALTRSELMAERTVGVSEARPSLDGWTPVTEADRTSARIQLAKMLAHPLFANSKRYPALLRHVVESTLEGKAEHLKERTLGIEVFGRKADYDTNLDPVVRITAGEIRKRIAQYYHEPEHESELRIDLPAGSYVPLFHLAQPARPVVAGLPDDSDAEVNALEAALPAIRRSVRWRAPVFLASGCALIALIAIVGSMKPWSPRTALDKFWSPILEAPGPVLLSIGEPSIARNRTRKSPVDRETGGNRDASSGRGTNGNTDGRRDRGASVNSDAGGNRPSNVTQETAGNGDPAGPVEETISEHIRNVDHIVLPDATTLVNLSGFLGRAGKAYHLQGTSSTTLTDLRAGPAILISAFDNPWTLRLTDPLRFHFVHKEGSTIFSIQDRDNPEANQWSVDFATPYAKLTEDYAVAGRFMDATTGQVLVIAAGIGPNGTVSAGEFLSDKQFMEQIAGQASRDWSHKNMEAVIATQVIDGKSGPPRVAAVHFW